MIGWFSSSLLKMTMLLTLLLALPFAPALQIGTGPGSQTPAGPALIKTKRPQLHIQTLEPFRVPNDQATPITIRGTQLHEVGQIWLLDPTLTIAHQLPFTLDGLSVIHATVPAGIETFKYFLVLVPSDLTIPLEVTFFWVDPPLPVVAGVNPAGGTSGTATPVTISGSGFTGATAFLLEGAAGDILPLTGPQVVDDATVSATIPAGLDAGPWKIRIVTPGGISAQTVSFTALPPSSVPPTVDGLTPFTGFNDVDNTFVVTGSGFTGATAVTARGDSDVSLTFLVSDDTTLFAMFPAGTPNDAYDILVQTPAGQNAASTAKFLLFDPNVSTDFLGDGSIVALNADTVAVATSTLGAVVERGRLRTLIRLQDVSVLESDDRGPEGNLGLEWDAQVPNAFEGSSATTLAGIVANPAAHGVDFVFQYNGVEAFRVTWATDAATGDLLQTLSWDTTDPSLPGNVWAVDFGELGIPAGHSQLLAADGGVKADWIDLSTPLVRLHPSRYELPLALFEDPLGGGLAFDMIAAGNRAALRTRSARGASGRFTTFHVLASVHEQDLLGGSLGPMRFSLHAGDWADAAETFQSGIHNPLKPSWHDSLSFAFAGLGTSGAAPGFDPQILEDLFTSLYVPGTAPPFPKDFRLYYSHLAVSQTNAELPDWTPTSRFDQIGSFLQSRGWRNIPYMATPGVNRNNPVYPAWAPYRLARWDKASQSIVYSCWDSDKSGNCEDNPLDYWNMNVDFQPYRAFILGEVQNGIANTFPFDGIFFDFMKPNIPLDDRNLLTGDPTDGYVKLVQEFSAALGGQPNGFAFSGEDVTAFLVNAGNFLALVHRTPPGSLGTDPLNAFSPFHLQHPLGYHLLAEQSRFMATLDLGSPTAHPAQHWMVRLPMLIGGTIPTAGAELFFGFLPASLGPESFRILQQIAENGWYWGLHHVHPWTDPSPLWDDPGTLRVYEVDGLPVARTQDWFVRKLVCDLYWGYGGRAPSQAELDNLAGRTGCNILGVFAAFSEVRAKFQKNPTPPSQIQTRPQARQAILAVFPAYPVP